MQTHAHYEQLCALAATGQIPRNEVASFKTHLAECSECSSQMQGFAQVGVCFFANEAVKNGRQKVPSGMTERFVARARTEGIPMSRNIVRRPQAQVWKRKAFAIAGVATAASLLIAAVLTAVKMRPLHVSRESVQPPVVLNPVVSAPVRPHGGSPGEVREQIQELQRQLAAARAEENALSGRLKVERGLLAAKDQELASLQAALGQMKGESATLKAGEGEYAAQVAKLEGDIEKLSSVKSASDIALMAEENELRSLRQTLMDKEAALRQQQHLVAVGNQARDLIVARNLHIIDVHDRDSDGNERRAFGRIFYTEGKSLVFYAYDLADPRKIDQQVSFYAWGERLDGGVPVKRLGIFHSEDVNDGRWVLTFDDPRVLAQIDSVFVTVEKEKDAVTRPKGEQILSTFLGNKANHP